MNVLGLLFGLGFGFVISAARLTDYDTIHRMLLLQEPDVYLLMGSAIAVALPLLRVLQSRGWVTPFGGRLQLSPSPVRRNHVLGSAVFGTGWAVAGTCPGPAVAMIGTGNLLGLLVVGGLFGGILLREAVAAEPRPAEVQPSPASAGKTMPGL
jgi:uncharacterized membrane protein YedE/YeeE